MPISRFVNRRAGASLPARTLSIVPAVTAMAVTMGLLLPGSLTPPALIAQQQEQERVTPAPDRTALDGQGPYDRLILRGVTVIDGTGAPPRGPIDVVIEGNRIVRLSGVGVPNVEIDEEERPELAIEDRPDANVHEIDATGMYVLPGFVDIHLHTGGLPKTPEAEYTYKLWMAHGITAGRGVAFGPVDWSLSEKERSARNEIVAPRMFSYHRPGSTGEGDERMPIDTPEQAREWVRYIAAKGADGLKLGSYRPEIMEALIDEATQLGLGTTAHLAQTGVAQMNAIDAARLGLGTVTHFYGLFESLYKDHDVQPWPDAMNYNDEQYRFGQVARQWNLIHERGSPEWKAFLEEMLEYDVTLDPTMTAYQASWDVEAQRQAFWNQEYVLPSLMDYYRASRTNHGSYYYDWTTADEVAWKNLRVWHQLLNDYKNMGGRVTVSSDAGFIYNTFGFSTIQEMELLQQAGFHPLEVIRGATLHAAETLFKPTGRSIEFGVVRPGLLADLVVVEENPLHNLKVLYGTGHVRLNDETGEPERVGGIKYTIKDGIVYDAKQLLEDVRRMVEHQKQERATATTTQDGESSR
jgi:imidazolonepropionase-like amidohydrolase